jgi:hypothetical protein
VARIAQIQSAFKSIGLSEDAAKRYAIGGPAGLNAEEMMQLSNQSERFKRAMADSALDAQVVANAASASQDSFERIVSITREWHTLWATLGPAIERIVTALTVQYAIMLKIDNLGALLGHKLGNVLTGKTDAAFSGDVGSFNWKQFQPTHLERMGFTIGGNGVNGLIKQSNYYLAIIANAAAKGIGGTNFGGGMATNLP